MRKLAEYAVYKGDKFLCVGTAKECADHLKVTVKTIRFRTTPTYKKRIAARKNSRNAISITRLEDDE
ncbi:hypothetical protein FQ087_18820 [Sporosarcina sp. ANT_H38]|nr:hypothetical protein [Sporosarcina sp. ANT_H38]KAA0944178.1 hypothetical protein FQ087_18820 [Sporosarcina sp. ANT_H38]